VGRVLKRYETLGYRRVSRMVHSSRGCLTSEVILWLAYHSKAPSGAVTALSDRFDASLRDWDDVQLRRMAS
jgi:hypothetical protein